MNLQRLTLLMATLLVGLSAGFFFTYESSVTLGLAEVGDVAYVEAFQAINRTVRNPAFGIVFFGSIPAMALAVAVNWGSARTRTKVMLGAALPLYLVGLMITGLGNVALNEELADYESLTSTVAAAARGDFEDDWNRLNLLRTIAISASFVALAAAGLQFPESHNERHPRRGIGENATL